VKEPAEQLVKEIRRATRRQFSAEEKIRIVLSGLRGEDSISLTPPSVIARPLPQTPDSLSKTARSCLVTGCPVPPYSANEIW
jgi:hypothetical protein